MRPVDSLPYFQPNFRGELAEAGKLNSARCKRQAEGAAGDSLSGSINTVWSLGRHAVNLQLGGRLEKRGYFLLNLSLGSLHTQGHRALKQYGID
jgi:hypothetical protein